MASFFDQLFSYCYNGQNNLTKDEIVQLLLISSVMSCHGRHIASNQTIRSADPKKSLEPNMKWIG